MAYLLFLGCNTEVLLSLVGWSSGVELDRSISVTHCFLRDIFADLRTLEMRKVKLKYGSKYQTSSKVVAERGDIVYHHALSIFSLVCQPFDSSVVQDLMGAGNVIANVLPCSCA